MKSSIQRQPSLQRKLILFSSLYFFVTGAALSDANVPLIATPQSTPETPSVGPSILEGAKLANPKETLKKYYPGMTSMKEVSLLPLERGGSSFMGLVSRLLGEGTQRELEGLRTRRYMYQAFDNDKMIGVAHGSSTHVGGNLVHVFVFYSLDGILRDFYIEGLPPSVEKTLDEGSYMKQFIGKSTEDFELVRGRRGKVKSRGAVLGSTRYPPSREARAYLEKILRSLRFNAAFVDVAFFITQHPDLAEKHVNEFPEDIQVTTQQPVAGPEAFIRERAQAPFASQAILQPLTPSTANAAQPGPEFQQQSTQSPNAP